MGRVKKVIFTVTNDLVTDQRMQRICGAFYRRGYDVVLVGRRLGTSESVHHLPYKTRRLVCAFNKGKLFYLEFNIRLFFYLLFSHSDLLWAVDCDTAVPARFVSLIKRIPWVFDAHELFTMVPEVINRKRVQAVWEKVQAMAFKRSAMAFTVGSALADWFGQQYGTKVHVLKNAPPLEMSLPYEPDAEKFILYQGALNEGRGLECLIRAMEQIHCKLLIAGEGDLSHSLRQMVTKLGLAEKVVFLGRIQPAALPALTRRAWIGYNVSEPKGLSYELSLNNKFFDYLHAGLPSLINPFSEYVKLNSQFQVGLLTNPSIPSIVENANLLLNDAVLHKQLAENCKLAATLWNWESEEAHLFTIFESRFPDA